MELTTLNVQVQDEEECESSFELRSKLDTLTKLYEAEKKKTEAEKFAAIVGVEKEKVEAENEKANIEAAKCA